MIERITEIQHYHLYSEVITFYRNGKQRVFTNPSNASCLRPGKIARTLARQHGWLFYPLAICAGWGLRKGEPA